MARWADFTLDEFACRCGCNTNLIDPFLIDQLQIMRTAIGAPFRINSGYRCLDHPIEAVKQFPGAHTTGAAADVACHMYLARSILTHALRMSVFTGIGIRQKGRKRFIHLDIAPKTEHRQRPALWTY